jgi:predicted SpoU family rRNA methylase
MKVKEISNEIAELLEKKNKDYGNSFDKTIEEYGITAYLLRIEDKISRLKSITKDKEVLVKDESMEDTIRDIAGYSILMLNYLNDKEVNNKCIK